MANRPSPENVLRAIRTDMNTEKIIQVPLPEEVKNALEDRAVENGRATGREAAQIIVKAMKKAKR